MPRITPNLWFDTEGEEAAEFYVSVFPNSKITNVTHYGEAGPRPAGTVLTVDFVLDGQEYTAINGGPQFTFDEAISLLINCADQDEIDYYWTKLTDGGEEGPCGWLKDKYGLSWQVVPAGMAELLNDPDQGRAPAGHEGHARHEEARHRRALRRRRPIRRPEVTGACPGRRLDKCAREPAICSSVRNIRHCDSNCRRWIDRGQLGVGAVLRRVGSAIRRRL